MLKRLFILFLMISTMTFSVVNDEVKFFSEKEIQDIDKRVEILEKKFGIKFQINIKEKESQNEGLNNLQKTVIIELLKMEDRVLKLNLKFSNDLEVNEYKDDINELLKNLEPLMLNGEYQDFIYELTANVSDIINLITIEDKRVEARMNAIKILKTVVMILFSLLVLFIAIIVLQVLIKKAKKRNRNNYCTDCNVRMTIFDKIEKNDRVIKVYKCHKCGAINQVMEKK